MERSLSGRTSAISGLPISALVNGRSVRSTWLLLSGTASSPARTSSASLTVIWALAGAATPKAAAAIAMAAPSAAPLQVLMSIAPHLIVLGFHSTSHADRVGRRSSRLDCPAHRGRRARLGQPCNAGLTLGRRRQKRARRPRIGDCRPSPRRQRPVIAVAKVIEADGLDLADVLVL